MKKNIGLILVGMCIAITIVFVWFTTKMSNIVNQDNATLQQVVQYLNSQIQASQKTATPTTPATPTK